MAPFKGGEIYPLRIPVLSVDTISATLYASNKHVDKLFGKLDEICEFAQLGLNIFSVCIYFIVVVSRLS